MIRIGCVGTGFIARRHLEVLSGFDDVQLVAVADPVRERAVQAAAGCGARAYDDGLDLLEREDLDAVYLCVPPFAHGPLERAALDRDLPFFVEKPLALDAATALDVADEVARRRLVAAVGYHWRHLDLVEQAQRLLAGAPPRLVLGSWLDCTPTTPWWSRSDGSGGQLLEQATHLFDLAVLLAGDVDVVYAEAARTPREAFPDADTAEASVATLRFASGALGTISSTCLLDWHDRIGLRVIGEGLVVEITERELRVRGPDVETTREVRVDPFVREDREFLDVVSGRAGGVRVPYREALRTHLVTTSAVRSIAEGAPVVVPAVPAVAALVPSDG